MGAGVFFFAIMQARSIVMAALAYLDSLGEYRVFDFHFFKYNFYSVLVI